MVVVHPSCYMRDLYDLDPDDESPWYCEKCAYLTKEHSKVVKKNNSNDSDHFATGVALRSQEIPNCMLCPESHGAMI